MYTNTNAIVDFKNQIREYFISEIESPKNLKLLSSKLLLDIAKKKSHADYVERVLFEQDKFDFFEQVFNINNFLIKAFKSNYLFKGGAILIDKNSGDFIFITEFNINSRLSKFIAISNNLELEEYIENFIFSREYEANYSLNEFPENFILANNFFRYHYFADYTYVSKTVSSQSIEFLNLFAIFKNSSSLDKPLSHKLDNYIVNFVRRNLSLDFTQAYEKILKNILKNEKYCNELSKSYLTVLKVKALVDSTYRNLE